PSVRRRSATPSCASAGPPHCASFASPRRAAGPLARSLPEGGPYRHAGRGGRAPLCALRRAARFDDADPVGDRARDQPVGVAGRVATVTLDRPEVKNALGPGEWREVAAAIARAAEDGSVQVVVVTGAAGTFCAGGDVKTMP